MKDLNMKAKIIKLIKDNVGEYLCGLELDNNFLSKISEVHTLGKKV